MGTTIIKPLPGMDLDNLHNHIPVVTSLTNGQRVSIKQMLSNTIALQDKVLCRMVAMDASEWTVRDIRSVAQAVTEIIRGVQTMLYIVQPQPVNARPKTIDTDSITTERIAAVLTGKQAQGIDGKQVTKLPE